MLLMLQYFSKLVSEISRRDKLLITEIISSYLGVYSTALYTLPHAVIRFKTEEY
jgi:hypothetical protein